MLFANRVAAYEVCPHCKIPMMPTGLNAYECRNRHCPGPDGHVQPPVQPLTEEAHPQCSDCSMPTLSGVCHYSGCPGRVVSKSAGGKSRSPVPDTEIAQQDTPEGGTDDIPVRESSLVKLSFSDFMMILPPEDRQKFDPFNQVSSREFLAALRQVAIQLGFTLPVAALTAMIYAVSKEAGLLQLSFSMVSARSSVLDGSRKTYFRALVKDFAEYCQSSSGGSVQAFAQDHASDYHLGACLSESSESDLAMADSLEIQLHEGNTVFLILDLPDSNLYLLLTPQFDEVGLENVIVTSQFVEEMNVDGWQVSSFISFLWEQLTNGVSGSRMLAILSSRHIETADADTKRR